MKKTNIIYLTTRCNLACDYCYEVYEGYQHRDSTFEQIDEFIEEIEEREKDYDDHTIVLMGGEPTIVYDELEYIIQRMSSSSKTYHASMSTNGILLNDDEFRHKFMLMLRTASSSNVNVDLGVSYDYKVHDKRKFRNGDSSREMVESTLDKLVEEGVSFWLSPTINPENCEDLIEYTVYMLEKYSKTQPLTKIRYSWNYQAISDAFGQDHVEKLKQFYDPYMVELERIYGVPLCGFDGETCAYCGKCEPQNFDGHRYSSPTKGIFTTPSITNNSFDKF